jgi:hypothetical protein
VVDWWFVTVHLLAPDWLGDLIRRHGSGDLIMQELIKIRKRIQKEYDHAVNTGDSYLEAEGLHTALRIIDKHIAEISEEKDI